MKKQEKPSSINKKGAVVGLVICFVGAIAMVGTYTFNNYQKGMEKQLAVADSREEENDTKKEKQLETQTTNADEIVLPESKETKVQEPAEETVPQTVQTETTETAGVGAPVNFQESDILEWPVSGNIVLNYSMDKTVYFSTLDQYKYNPALIIAGEVDGTVIAAAKGIVQSIDVSAQTGNTVTVDMGNGYQAVYGQLKEVPVQIGELVEANQTIGYLSEPTKYYSVEGCNLYFQLKKDGVPVNPMEYMGS